MQKIIPSLWFNNNAEEAIDFYASIFKQSKVLNKTYYGEGQAMPKGTLLVASFELAGQQLTAMNAGPQFPFTEAISFTVTCKDQEELDYYWSRLTADGGKEVQCGWLKDKYGLSWQIVPAILSELISDKDNEKGNRVLQAVWSMVKLDIAALQKAYDGK